ncbi:unnamed protein product [Urochloa humidicola]
MMTRKNKPLDRTAELLLRVSVVSWKARYKLAGKGQLCKLCKRGVHKLVAIGDCLLERTKPVGIWRIIGTHALTMRKEKQLLQYPLGEEINRATVSR